MDIYVSIIFGEGHFHFGSSFTCDAWLSLILRAIMVIVQKPGGKICGKVGFRGVDWTVGTDFYFLSNLYPSSLFHGGKVASFLTTGKRTPGFW